MTAILVFGGAGYIGSHTCKRLRAEGFDPVVFDNLSEGRREFVKWGELREGDIRDADAVTAAFEAVKPAAAIHCAAHARVEESVRDPALHYGNNIPGSLNIAVAARDAGGAPLIFSSSGAVYGAPGPAPIPEDAPLRPINPYGHGKRMVEQILADFDAAYGLRSVSLRYFNACGADAEGEIGEAHRDETHLVPRAIFSALGRLDDFEIFGDDYDTPDGSAVRDYVHVTDLAEAHVLACRHVLEGGGSDRLNLGTGTGISVLEVIEAVRNITGQKVPHRVSPRRPGDPPVLVADPSRARQVLGFAPRHSALDNIVATATAWHRANP